MTPAQREGNRQHLAQKLSAIATLKLERGCADCGYAEDPVALDFDHLEEKVQGIAVMSRRHSIEAILEEAEKCDVVCANCHRVRTAEEGRFRRGSIDKT